MDLSGHVLWKNLTHILFKHKTNIHILSAESRCQTCRSFSLAAGGPCRCGWPAPGARPCRWSRSPFRLSVQLLLMSVSQSLVDCYMLYVCIYIYIYMHIICGTVSIMYILLCMFAAGAVHLRPTWGAESFRGGVPLFLQRFEWHYLSIAACLTRPHVFYPLLIVSRITIICQTYSPRLNNTCVRQVVLDKWFPLTHSSAFSALSKTR